MVLGHYDATLEERTSKKGTSYKVLVIKLSDNVEKLVFLSDAERELLEMKKINNSTSPTDAKSPFDF